MLLLMDDVEAMLGQEKGKLVSHRIRERPLWHKAIKSFVSREFTCAHSSHKVLVYVDECCVGQPVSRIVYA